jgi:hypothetical protein
VHVLDLQRAHESAWCRRMLHHLQLQLVTPDHVTRDCRAGVHVQHAGRAAPKPWQCRRNGAVGGYAAKRPARSGWRPDRPDYRCVPTAWKLWRQLKQLNWTVYTATTPHQLPVVLLVPQNEKASKCRSL